MGYSTMAIQMREPATIWISVVKSIHFHVITLMAQTHSNLLHQGKRNFDIIVAIFVAIIVGIAGVTTTVVALT